jgi:integrase
MPKLNKTRTPGVYWVPLKNGKRSYLYTFRDDEGKQVTRRTRSFDDARGRKREAEEHIANGDYVSNDAGKAKLGEIADEWLLSVEAGDCKPKTILGYRSLLRSRIIPTFGTRAIGGIKPGHINTWLAGMKKEALSGSRRLQAFRVLSAVLQQAVEAKLITENPARPPSVQIPRKSKDKKRIALTHEQVATVVESFDEQWQPLILTLAYCGLRFGEAAALRRSAIDLERGQLRISQAVTEVSGHLSWGTPKNDQARDVDMPPFLISLLADHLDGPVGLDDEALVFTSPMGMTLRYRNFRNHWDPAIARASAKDQKLEGLTPHDLRHAAAGLMLQATRDLFYVKEQLGHSTIQVTERYAWLLDDDRRRNAALLDSARRAALDSDVEFLLSSRDGVQEATG